MDSLFGLRLLSDAGYIVSMCPHLLDYKDKVDNLISNRDLLDKITGLSRKRSQKRAPRKTAVATTYSAANRELPSEFYRMLQEIGGVELKLIMEKPLTTSDLNRGLGRLSFPSDNLLSDFLSPEEQEHLENRREVPVVVVIEPSLEVSSLALKSWKMSKGLVHVVTGGWNRVAHSPNNRLQKKDIIQVWSFRTGTRLGMALVKVKIGEEETSGAGSQPPPSPTNF
ncbi:hypothetical protein SAY87_015145 [Trapa incisa]|uniref:TF-B3 domain-containing protein n=1 Tax=Trapa incisa TaxID=236973 RepID=A0AAN7H0N9_9MYRT|nr:hypothetical protein SAY87_015145 [Trapa incisa]